MNMRTNVSARIGQWYRHLDKGESFLVTGQDERTGTLEIQSFDGDLDEVDAESWAELHIAPCETWDSTADGSDDMLQTQGIPDEDLAADSTTARDLVRRDARDAGGRP